MSAPYGNNPGGYGNPYAQGGPGMGPGGLPPNDPFAQRLNQILMQHEINPQLGPHLQVLRQFEIVVLCDDSGSMNMPVPGTNTTRWDELKRIVNVVVGICSVMDANGVDIYFLNRPPALNVTNTQNIQAIFNAPPQGLTPLVPALRSIIAAKRSISYEKKLLILIATDGEPTGEFGQPDVGTLEGVLRNERTPQTYVTFLACTDDRAALAYLNGWDRSIPNVDVVDDYRNEQAEVQRIRGPSFPFSYGDYIVKALLGSTDQRVDFTDERL